MKLINPFKKQQKQNKFIEVKYSKLDHIGKVKRYEIPDKNEIDNQINNVGNQINDINNQITNVEDNINKLKIKILRTKEYIETLAQFEKTEIKPGLYLYTLISLPSNIETISGGVINQPYFIEFWIKQVHIPDIDGTWLDIHKKYKTDYYYSQSETIMVNTLYSRNKNHKSISFISEVNLTDVSRRVLIQILCFPGSY